MSAQASAAATSKFQAFMNHPAGVDCPWSAEPARELISTSPGPRTVFFWAPLMKWCLVAAGVKDLNRPAEKLSVSQNVGAYTLVLLLSSFSAYLFVCDAGRRVFGEDCFEQLFLLSLLLWLWDGTNEKWVLSIVALAATGFIWVRYSLVITPINYSLAAVRRHFATIFRSPSDIFRSCLSIGQLLRWCDRTWAAH